MKARSIAAIVSILIVISIMIIIGIKLVRDIVKSNVAEQNTSKNNTPDDPESDDNVTEDALLNNIMPGEVSPQQMNGGGNSYAPRIPGEEYDVELPARILIVQTVQTNDDIPTQTIQSKAKVEEVSSRSLNSDDTDFGTFDKQASVPIDTSLNILDVEQVLLPRIDYANIECEDSSKITFETYDRDDKF